MYNAATNDGCFVKTLPTRTIMHKAAIYGGNLKKTLHLPSTVSKPVSFANGFSDYKASVKAIKRIEKTGRGNLKSGVTL